MAEKVDANRWQVYLLARKDGLSKSAAATKAGISRATVMRMEQGNQSTPEYRQAKAIFDDLHPKGVVPHDELCPEAKRALGDFADFRLRYFGRYSTPWQVDAAEQIVALLNSEEKEYLVQNVAPGTGKSTLWHDIICWLICRDRAVRIMVGSASERTARAYGGRVQRSLERTMPLKGDAKLVERGLVADAQATLVGDFGRFKPPNRDLWRKEEFVVDQADGQGIDDKEATLSTYGRDGTFLGGRFDFVLWDDLVTKKTLRTGEAIESLETWWDDEAESRLEPGGLMVLQGQRLSSHDLYRYCLDKPGGYLDDEDGEPVVDVDSRMYRHIVYKTHYADHCRGLHKRSDLAYDPKLPDTSGCLIDPRRIPWSECVRRMANKAESWLVVYQQEDTDPSMVLVQKLWVYGGRDTDTGQEFPGCFDDNRSTGQIPKGLSKPWLLVVTADPSPAKFWSVQMWLYHPGTEQRFLIDHERARMTAPEFLDWDINDGKFVGLLENWWLAMNKQGEPFRWVVVERMAAQRFLLQYDHVKKWAAKRGVQIIGHDTYGNKTDEDLGVTTLGPHWRDGRVRLPNNRQDGSRGKAMALVNEVTSYPDGKTDDCVMAEWFFEYTLQRQLKRTLTRPEKPPQRVVPSWLRGGK